MYLITYLRRSRSKRWDVCLSEETFPRRVLFFSSVNKHADKLGKRRLRSGGDARGKPRGGRVSSPARLLSPPGEKQRGQGCSQESGGSLSQLHFSPQGPPDLSAPSSHPASPVVSIRAACWGLSNSWVANWNAMTGCPVGEVAPSTGPG